MPGPANAGERLLTSKGRATRERIVAAAAGLIVSGGLSALTMDGLRRAASVSGSQLAHYFTDKRAILHAVLDQQMQRVLDFHSQPRLGALDTFDDFERWIALNLAYLRKTGYTGTPTYHALAGQLAKSDDETRAHLAAGYRDWTELLEAAIRRMKDNGLLVARADPTAIALVFIGAHQGGGTMTYAYREEWPLTDALRFAVNHLRSFAVDPAERAPRPVRRPRRRSA
jgi:AcrR family transcriptional regulator